MNTATDIITRLIDYAGHNMKCKLNLRMGATDCTCGYSAAIADAREFLEGERVMTSDHTKDVPHEYRPSTVGHGETQCVWCRGTNRENAIISPNHCKQRAQAISEATESVEAGVLAMDSSEIKPTLDELKAEIDDLMEDE